MKIIILGAGQVGASVAENLVSEANDITLVDTSAEHLAMLRDRLQQAILASANSGQIGMLLLLDIDRFKQLNDTRGHALGDELLRAIAHRLRLVKH